MSYWFIIILLHNMADCIRLITYGVRKSKSRDGAKEVDGDFNLFDVIKNIVYWLDILSPRRGGQRLRVCKEAS